jgi:hypothetical protein
VTHTLDAAWMLTKAFSYSGLVVALSGVAIFGWYFVRINAVAARGDTNEIPTESWRGHGAKRGMLVLAVGAGMQLASFIMAASLPSGP